MSTWTDTTAALRTGSPEMLRRALLSQVHALAFADDRDVMMILAPYHHCARRLGVDPRALFDDVATGMAPDAAELLREFGARRDVRPRSFGFTLDKDADGPFYRAAGS